MIRLAIAVEVKPAFIEVVIRKVGPFDRLGNDRDRESCVVTDFRAVSGREVVSSNLVIADHLDRPSCRVGA